MIKKSPSKAVVRRKLVVRREIISQLTPRELEQVAGGYSIESPDCGETKGSTPVVCLTEPA